MAKSGFTELILSFWWEGREYEQKLCQRAQFEHSDRLDEEMGKSGFRELSSSILSIFALHARAMRGITSENF